MKKYLVSIKKENASNYVVKHDGEYDDLGYVIAKSMKNAVKVCEEVLNLSPLKISISELSEADASWMEKLN